MIKSLIKRFLGKGDKPAAAAGIPRGRRVDITPDCHNIDPRLVDDRAIQVVTALKNAGFEAYVVGGAVRDLLVGRAPKDFDVATNATPEQVKSLFRRAFIIGRRFRIVHVIFGRGRDHEVIEVSTFRAYLDPAAAQTVEGNERTAKQALAGKEHAVDASGRVLRDNVWGPQDEDAARRDFTVNAMYYDPITRVVVDYHDGFGDVQRRVLRMIGDPATRYVEDPVRVIRVVRFAAKLGFEIEAATKRAMPVGIERLADVPVSRLFDEMIKLLQTGHALASVEALRRHRMEAVFPVLHQALAHEAGSESARLVELALADTDRRVGEGKPVAPSFLLACLCWSEVRSRWEAGQAAGETAFPALQAAIDAVFEARIGDISGRGKLAADMREIWQMQPRFERRVGSGPRSLVEQPRFRAAFDFLRLRADAGEVPQELAEWWEDYSMGSDEDREAMLAAMRERPKPRRVPRADAGKPAAAAAGPKRERSGGVSSSASSGPGNSPATQPELDLGLPGEGIEAAGETDVEEAASGDGAPVRRRRRRRRRPAGEGGGSGSTLA